jgi:hypothetical protein
MMHYIHPVMGRVIKFSYTDVCGNKSLQSPEACPIFSNGDPGGQQHHHPYVEAYTGWQNGVDHYVVEKFNEQGQLLQTFNTGTTHLVDDEEDFDNQTYVYRITAIAKDAGIPILFPTQSSLSKRLFSPTQRHLLRTETVRMMTLKCSDNLLQPWNSRSLIDG